MYLSMFWALRTLKREQTWWQMIHSERVLSNEGWYSLLANRSGQADYQRKHCHRQCIPEVMLSSCVLNPSVCFLGSSLCSSVVCVSRVGGQTVWKGAWLCAVCVRLAGTWSLSIEHSPGNPAMETYSIHRQLSLAKTQIKVLFMSVCCRYAFRFVHILGMCKTTYSRICVAW